MLVRPVLAAVALLPLAATMLGAQEPVRQPGVQPVPSVLVTGEGQARATPDRAFVTVGVESRASTASAAAADNARRQRAILDTLRKMGFPPEQLSTSNYSVQPEMQYDQNGQRARVVGYVVSNTVRVDVRQIDRVGPVIDASLAAGANQVHGLQLYLSDPGPARRAAIADAVSRARADAEALARAAGGSLGQILELSTVEPQMGPVMYRQPAMAVARDMAVSTPIEVGEEVVRAIVHVRWAFVQR